MGGSEVETLRLETEETVKVFTTEELNTLLIMPVIVVEVTLEVMLVEG